VAARKSSRKSSRFEFAAMYMSNLDAKGFLGTDELSALLNHNALVQTTEIGTCDTGKYAVAQVLWWLQWALTWELTLLFLSKQGCDT